MELLKKMMVLTILILSTKAIAQDYNTLQIAFAKSITYETKAEYKNAIEAIKTVHSSNNYETNMRLGWLNYLAGNNTDSETYYEKAALLMPASVEALWGLTYPLAELKKWSTLSGVYQKILKLDPKNTTANYRLGLSAYYSKDYITAKKYFDVVLGLYPMDYNALLMNGWTNYFIGKKTEAKILFNKVLMVAPTDSSAKEGLALLK